MCVLFFIIFHTLLLMFCSAVPTAVFAAGALYVLFIVGCIVTETDSLLLVVCKNNGNKV